MTNYWWANQSDNFERVKGTLWTNFLNAGGARRAGAVALGETKPGDVVFHCDDKFIRTVSVVVSEPVATRRPPNYQSRQSGNEDDEGWLVLVQPLVDGLQINRRSDVPFIEHGGLGPFNKLGGLKFSGATACTRTASLRWTARDELCAPPALRLQTWIMHWTCSTA